MGPLIVSSGEPAGIGGEIALRAWLARRERQLPAFCLIDDPARLERLADRLGLPVRLRAVDHPSQAEAHFDDALPVLAIEGGYEAEPGTPVPSDAPKVIAAISTAVRFCMDGEAAGIVTNPISKAHLYAAGFSHPGHTEFVADLSGGAQPVMMLAGPRLRVVPATVHCPLSEVPQRLTSDGLIALSRVTAKALEQDFGLTNPRIAMAGLNPHAGESGAIGQEDDQIIRPAIERLRGDGIAVSGPWPADSMFHDAARASYDAAICMYHDQALIPVKTLDFDRTVNVTLGLPVVRTSPDHGTAFDIAGQGIARPDSLIEAILLAGEIAARRSGG